jgi:RHS repeat-associated protein
MPVDQQSPSAILTYTYDLDANLTCIAYPGAGNTCTSSPGSGNDVVDYAYDHDDRMSTITDWDGDTLTYTYNHDSVPQELSANSAAVTDDLSYDAGGNITELDIKAGATTLLKLVYSYDDEHNPTQETPTIGATTQTIENFDVDAADRVNIFWTGSGAAPAANVNYGNDGEIEQNGTVAAAQGMGYDEAGELCWSYSSTSANACSSPPSGSATYTYDDDGERTAVTPASGNDQSYDWNAANELICANTNGSSCSLGTPTGTTTLYGYDGNGLRTSSTISSATTDYTWDTSTGTPRLVGSGSTDYVYGLGSAPVLQLTGSASDLLLSDPIGSVHGLVQLSSGGLQDKLVNYTDYDAYGNPTNTGGLTQSHTGISANWSVTSGIGYAASYEDTTALVYMQDRYYDSATGQFMSVDPSLQMTHQAYIYASNIPTSDVDPTGAWPSPYNPPDGYNPWVVGVVLAQSSLNMPLQLVAAFVGNFMEESNGCNPNYKPPAAGIAQWGTNRWNLLVAWGNKNGLSNPYALTTQNAYVLRELTSPPLNYSYNNYTAVPKECDKGAANTTGVTTDTVCVMNDYEQPDPSLNHQSRRVTDALWAYSWLAQGNPWGPPGW